MQRLKDMILKCTKKNCDEIRNDDN